MMSPKTNSIDEIPMNNSNEIINGKGIIGILSKFNRKHRHMFDVDLKVKRVLSLPYASGTFFFQNSFPQGWNSCLHISSVRFILF